MKETVNFGFKKPESTDFVDVGVFGENFDKIDAELARKTIPIVLDQEIDLRQDINSIDVTDQIAAVADRFVADLKRGIPVSVTFTTENTPVTVLLKDWFETNPEMYTVSGICPNFHDITAISQFNLSVNLGYHSELQYTANVGGGSGLPADFPVSVDENGYTQIAGLPRATNIDNVLDGDVLTVTSTLQDGRTIPGTMTFDANGMPESYTEEGVACKFSFTGFEKPKTVELPVVELNATGDMPVQGALTEDAVLVLINAVENGTPLVAVTTLTSGSESLKINMLCSTMHNPSTGAYFAQGASAGISVTIEVLNDVGAFAIESVG